jgi:hypothetical protein
MDGYPSVSPCQERFGYAIPVLRLKAFLLSFLFSSLLSGNRNIFPSRAKFVGLMLAVFQPATQSLS